MFSGELTNAWEDECMPVPERPNGEKSLLAEIEVGA